MLIEITIFAGVILTFASLNVSVVRLMARRDGFKRITYNLSELGPVLLFCRWGAVRIGGSRWSGTVAITAFRHHIHIKLNRVFGGGEILLPLEGADYQFSQYWLYGEVVDIILPAQTYGFGQIVAKMVKQHYL